MQTSEITQCRDCGDTLGSNSLCRSCNAIEAAGAVAAAPAAEPERPLYYAKGAPTDDMLLAACGMTPKQARTFQRLLANKLASLNSIRDMYVCNEWHASCIDQRSGLFFVVLRVGMRNPSAAQQVFFDESWSGTIGPRGAVRSASSRKGARKHPRIYGWEGFGSHK